MLKPALVFACLMVFFGTSADEYSSEFLQSYSELNGKCASTRDCRSFGYVCRDNKTCKCDSMYVPDAYKRKCVGGVDQKCVYDEHCIDGAYCMNQAICKCKENTPVVLEEGLLCGNSIYLHTYDGSLQYFLLFVFLMVFA